MRREKKNPNFILILFETSKIVFCNLLDNDNRYTYQERLIESSNIHDVRDITQDAKEFYKANNNQTKDKDECSTLKINANCPNEKQSVEECAEDEITEKKFNETLENAFVTPNIHNILKIDGGFINKI